MSNILGTFVPRILFILTFLIVSSILYLKIILFVVPFNFIYLYGLKILYTNKDTFYFRN